MTKFTEFILMKLSFTDLYTYVYLYMYVCVCVRLSTLVTLVSDGLQMECCSEGERVNFGEHLKTAIASFTVDFLPHMREEEEVGYYWNTLATVTCMLIHCTILLYEGRWWIHVGVYIRRCIL